MREDLKIGSVVEDVLNGTTLFFLSAIAETCQDTC